MLRLRFISKYLIFSHYSQVVSKNFVFLGHNQKQFSNLSAHHVSTLDKIPYGPAIKKVAVCFRSQNAAATFHVEIC